VKAEQVATFLGKKITPQLAQEIGNRFTTRIEGTCIKHRLGKAGVKMYDELPPFRGRFTTWDSSRPLCWLHVQYGAYPPLVVHW
jgi:hypothetical protein